MNWYFASAGALAFTVGLVHSVLGERLIFQHLRKRGLVPTDGGGVLVERNVRILWASWHVVTVLGWCMAYLLICLSLPSSHNRGDLVFVRALIVALLASSALVLIGTKARHPGWVGLLGVAILTWLGRSA